MKTNAARVLDQQGVRYQLRTYEVDLDDLSAPAVAAKVHMPADQVFKTLVARGDRSGVLLAVVAADAELDLKAIARLSGDRKVDLVPLREVQQLTGYVRGGVTAIACKKAYPVFVDQSMTHFDQVCVSAGIRGAQLLLAPTDYVAVVRAKIGPIAKLSGCTSR